MLAEILTFGDELCRGEIVDTNSSWLAAELWDLDITCAWMTSCRDVAEDMRQALRAACARADVVVCSGGLGPTEDDLTVDVVGVVGPHRRCTGPASAHGGPLRGLPPIGLTHNTVRQGAPRAGSRGYDNPPASLRGFEWHRRRAVLAAWACRASSGDSSRRDAGPS